MSIISDASFLPEESKERLPADGSAGKTPPLDVAQRFRELADQWEWETGWWSNITKTLNHPAYLAIIALGQPAVPLLIRELRDRPSLWYDALKKLTGQSPVTEIDLGDLRRIREAWLRWGREKGYIE